MCRQDSHEAASKSRKRIEGEFLPTGRQRAAPAWNRSCTGFALDLTTRLTDEKGPRVRNGSMTVFLR